MSTSHTITAPAKERLREPLKKSTVQEAKAAIRDLIDRNKDPDGSRPFTAGLLRLSFHDCVGPTGCDGCINHKNEANEGKVVSLRSDDPQFLLSD